MQQWAALRQHATLPRHRAWNLQQLAAVAGASNVAAGKTRRSLYLAKVDSFLRGNLQPYEYNVESEAEAALRLSGMAVAAAKRAAMLAPMGFAGKAALSAADFARQYGLHGVGAMFYHEDFLESAKVVSAIASDMGAAHGAPMADILGAMYYEIAETKGRRGAADPLELEAAFAQLPVPAPLLAEILHHAPLALRFAYEPVLEAQRLLKLKGYALIAGEEASAKSQPSFMVAANPVTRRAVLIVRGSHSALDWLTNSELRSEPLVPLPLSLPQAPAGAGISCHSASRAIASHGGPTVGRAAAGAAAGPAALTAGTAHSGMTRAARWLQAEVGPAMRALAAAGYRVAVTGHSLGAGVGALLTCLERERVALRSGGGASGESGSGENGGGSGGGGSSCNWVCYSFATPPCADATLCGGAEAYVTSVVLQDDIVPRASVQNLERLLVGLSHKTGENPAAYGYFALWSPSFYGSEVSLRDHTTCSTYT